MMKTSVPSTRRRHGVRRLTAFALGFALAALPLASASSAVAAADAEWWYEAYDVPTVQQQGWTGDGVKVAVIDAAINPDLPVFQGRNLTVAEGELCKGASPVSSEPTEEVVHGTTVAATIIGNGTGAGAVQGIAPGADVTFYGTGEGTCATSTNADLHPIFVAMQRAVDDGARIVVCPLGLLSLLDTEQDVIANAVAKGVILVFATNNVVAGSYGTTAFPWSANGIVAVSAVDRNGDPLKDAASGEPVINAGTTVVAPGDISTVGLSSTGSWDQTGATTGASISAPIVGGMLAVAAQRYPEATGNQLIQSLIRNTGREPHEFSFDEAGGTGYGTAWLTRLVDTDPSQYPDENPLMDKPYGKPSAEQVAAAAERGFALPDWTPDSFAEYEDDPGAGPTGEENEATASDPLAGLLIGGGIALGVIVVAGVVVAIVLVNVSRKKARQGGPS